MKKLFLLLPLVFWVSGISFAQKFGYVNTDYILGKMPEYQKAQSEIQTLATAWQEEIQQMYKSIEANYANLKAEEVLLTREMKEERVAEIRKKEEEVKEYHNKVFGVGGLYFLKKKELVKPVQEKVFEAVDKVARANRLAMVFDKAGDLVMIYTDPVHDYTDFVLEELGIIEKVK
ncbi:MAG: OmpH family outer membrane protein [Cyclobacteriaceae bacterium]|nr:OmpH family outer membrane protein [Cyclobacteriaceae bacterium]